jgi:DNA-binding PadR family transcriptional regulator
LASGTASSKEDLPRDIAMPMLEVERAADILKREGLLMDDQQMYQLTEKGKQTAQYLFEIADSHQNDVFEKYPLQEKEAFISMLRDFAGVA